MNYYLLVSGIVIITLIIFNIFLYMRCNRKGFFRVNKNLFSLFEKNSNHCEKLYLLFKSELIDKNILNIIFKLIDNKDNNENEDINDQDIINVMYECLLSDSKKYEGKKLMPVFFELIGLKDFSRINDKFRYSIGLNLKGKKNNIKVKEEFINFKKFINFENK